MRLTENEIREIIQETIVEGMPVGLPAATKMSKNAKAEILSRARSIVSSYLNAVGDGMLVSVSNNSGKSQDEIVREVMQIILQSVVRGLHEADKALRSHLND